MDGINSLYGLTDEHLTHYREKGWVCLRGVLSPEEVAFYGSAIREAAMTHNQETRPLEERDTYGKAFLQVMNLWTVDERVRAFTLAKRLADVARRLTESTGVRLYHDQALFKEPGGGHTPWHQDQFYWPLGTDRATTLWMPMVDVSAEMGSMTFASGSHRAGFVPMPEGISDASEAFFDAHVSERGYPLETAGAMAAGDATFHGGWTLHRAPGNPTSTTREVMTVIYYPDGAEVIDPANEFQRNDLRTWLNDLPIGAPAASELNPLL